MATSLPKPKAPSTFFAVECPIPDGWASLSEEERFLHPDFNPDTCANHAKIMLQPKRADVGFWRSLFSWYSCSDYAKARRNINLSYHPDLGHIE